MARVKQAEVYIIMEVPFKCMREQSLGILVHMAEVLIVLGVNSTCTVAQLLVI